MIMRYLFGCLLLSMTLLTIACDPDNCDAEMKSYTVQADKSIQIAIDTLSLVANYQVSDGENLVFQYHHVRAQCDNIADDEWAETLSFEVDKNAETFMFEDADLNLANCFVRESGAWVNGSSNPIMKGMITGTKKNNNDWDVEISIVVDPLNVGGGSREIVLEEVFELE